MWILKLFIGAFAVTFAFSQTCEYKIIWDRDFCNETDSDRLQNSILPPSDVNNFCEFEMGSVLNLEHLNGDLYENLFQVEREVEFATCDASNSQSIAVVINSIYNFTLDPGNFAIGDEVYFISTSSGTNESAINSRKISHPCLKLAFKIVASTNQCGTNSRCENSVLSQNQANFGCGFGKKVNNTVLIIIYITVPVILVLLIICFLVACCVLSDRKRAISAQKSAANKVTEMTSI